VEQSLFEFAGGEDAMLALATAHHRRCLQDPELNHPFSHDDLNPEHVQRLAWYWGEVLGGPPRFSQSCGGQHAVLWMHSGNGDMSDLGERFLACFLAAMDEVELPADARFRSAMAAYMRWAVDDVLAYSPDGSEVPDGAAMPRWGWDGPVSAG
jgi:hemoglobin